MKFKITSPYLLILFLFISQFCFALEKMSPDQDAVTFAKEKIDELILQHFVKQIAVTAYGDIQSDILTNPNSFDLFFKNYNYNPNRLATEISFKTPSYFVEKNIKYTLKSIEPFNKHSIYFSSGEYFLYCKTLRGPRILCFTSEPLVDALFYDKFKNWNISIISLQSFAKNLLLNEKYYNEVIKNQEFSNLIYSDLKPVNSKYFSGS
jgi:hypothetical protein